MAHGNRLAFLRLRFHRGVRSLAPEWKALASPSGLARDVRHGLVLAATTLPLALFLAALSGAPASSGVISAVVGSLVSVILGGTRLALSGPSLAIALVASSVVGAHGMRGLGVALVVCGLLQLAVGMLCLGRFIRLVPTTVIRACVIGIGASILLAQLPLSVGAEIEADAGMLERLDHLGAQIPRASGVVLGIAGGGALLGAVSIVRPGFPGAFVALVLATAAVVALGADVPTLVEPEHFARPAVPHLPSTGLAQVAGASFELFSLCALTTLVNAAALERIDRAPVDHDQELIGNGAATALVAFLGGLPTAQWIARSELGVRLGVTSRRPALIQALVIAAVGLALFRFTARVPLVGLTGVAIATAVPLLDPRPLREVARVSRFEIVVGLATVLASVFGSVPFGVVIGLALAFGAAALRLARTHALLHASEDRSSPHQLSWSGAITFLAALELDRLREDLSALDATRGLIVDLRSVVAMDASGALALVRILDEVRARGGKVALMGPPSVVRERIARADEQPRTIALGIAPGDLAHTMAGNDREADRILGKTRSVIARPKLLAGIARFREEAKGHYESLFSSLADGQEPHTMFITCADSRIDPALLMGSHPGDLFIVRAIGALVAPSGHEAMFQEGAALEYAVGVLGVRNIVVCGHSKCGAVAALRKAHVPVELGTLGTWAEHAAEVAGEVASFSDGDEAARAVTVRQIEHLRSYPLVREKHDEGELQIHAWFYDLGAVELFEWSPSRERYEVLGEDPSSDPPASPTGPAEGDAAMADQEAEG